MLLKPGYKGVYISRPFAIKNKLVPKTVSRRCLGESPLPILDDIPSIFLVVVWSSC
jgi:hypothetical protein